MFRRWLSLLLIPTFPLQGMCFAHYHVEVHAPLEHDRTPHFHASGYWFMPSQHRHDDGDHDGDDEHEELSLYPQGPTRDHDDDAVYMAVVVMLTATRATHPVDLGQDS